MKKSYFVYKENDDWYFRENERWERLFFWGNPKFMVTSLVDLFGVDKWKKVFEDFMAWVKNIKNLQIFFTWKQTATFVLYEKNLDDNKKQWSVHPEEV